MSTEIHATALVDPTARLGEGVQIGPYCVVGRDVEIGDNTMLASHVVLEDRTVVGKNCQIAPGAVLGGAPQDLAYQGELTRVRIGDHNLIREYVTINRATGEGNETVVGDHCFLMAYSHLAHNCLVGNHVILANAVQIAGYVQLGDYAFVGGGCVVHQFVKIGRMAFLGGASATRQDLPPFSMNDNRPSTVQGINSVGLKRRGLTAEQRQRLKKAFYYLFFSGLNQTQAIEAIRQNLEIDNHVQELLDFVATSKRGINYKRPTSQQGAADDASEANLLPV